MLLVLAPFACLTPHAACLCVRCVQAGIERKAATRNLFMKLKSLTEAQELLSPQAAAAVDLGKVFGVTQRDILTLSSGYSAEEEGSALQDDSEGEGGVAA